MLGLLDVELDDVVVIVDHVCGRRSHGVSGIGPFPASAPQQELVIALTGKAVQYAARIAEEVAPLR
jgi:hypothetical protein